MLALFVKVPTIWRLRKIRSFSANSKYFADNGPLLRFRTVTCVFSKQTLQ